MAFSAFGWCNWFSYERPDGVVFYGVIIWVCVRVWIGETILFWFCSPHMTSLVGVKMQKQCKIASRYITLGLSIHIAFWSLFVADSLGICAEFARKWRINCQRARVRKLKMHSWASVIVPNTVWLKPAKFWAKLQKALKASQAATVAECK